MKKITIAVAVAAFSTVAAVKSLASDALVNFGEFTPAKGAQFVEVNIQSNLISMVTRLAKGSEPEVAEILGGLKQVRVNVLGLTDENREQISERIAKIRSDLDTQGWQRIVTAMENQNDVGVFLKMRGDEAIEGLVVTVIEDNRQAVLVNVVGEIRPEKLAVVGERFDIEPLKKLNLAAKE